MSYARKAGRLAIIEALNPSRQLPVIVKTLAGTRVYDSRIDPVAAGDDLDTIEGSPLIGVYSEEDYERPYNPQENRFPPQEQIVNFDIELMIAARGTVTVDGPNGTETYGTIEAPISDAQHEGLLDDLEGQVRLLLDKKLAWPQADLFRQVIMEVHEIRSVPQREADRLLRLAARTLRLRCKLKTEVWTPGAVANVLPVPLSLIAAAVPPDSYAGQVCAISAAGIPAIPGPPTGASVIAIFSALGRLPDPSGTGADADVTSHADQV